MLTGVKTPLTPRPAEPRERLVAAEPDLRSSVPGRNRSC
jgi:hypothetical protein